MQNNYRGITANFVPVTAELPQLPRYYRLSRFRAQLYCVSVIFRNLYAENIPR